MEYPSIYNLCIVHIVDENALLLKKFESYLWNSWTKKKNNFGQLWEVIYFKLTEPSLDC